VSFAADISDWHFRVNGSSVSVTCEAAEPLLSVLRNRLGLVGTRFGCGTEQCGTCVVLIDGEPAFSCTRPVENVAGREITTVEGLAGPAGLHPLQDAILQQQAGQCGYCLSGILVSAAALLARNPEPTRAEIALALDKHLCRCGVHNRIIRAVELAARRMAAAAP
jgi:aerobic-type carbon monoxide dehydrogenase small subunit (CoxS/CutS family)